MYQRFCDRCKKKIRASEKHDILIKTDKEDFYKEVCKECVNDIMNMIDYECNRFKLDTVVTINKEASQNDM